MKNELTPTRIAALVRANHGGFDGAPDGACLTLWRSLDTTTQAAYIARATGEEVADADGN